MAIKIPVRSSASESVGGKTIRVPHGGQGAVALPRGSKLIERVPRISGYIDRIGDDLLQLAAVKKAHDRKIEDQRQKNLAAKRKSLLADELDDLIENMRNNNNLATDSSASDFLSSTEDYESHYKLAADKLIQKYTKLYKDDDDAFAMFEPDMYELIRSGQGNMRKVRRKKVVAEGNVAFHIENQLIDKQLDGLSADTVFLALPKINKKIKEIYITALTNGFVTEADVTKRLSDIELTAWKTVVSAGKEYVDDMTNKAEINYQAIYNELSASKATGTYFGKKLTKEMKDKLLKWSFNKAKQQKTMKVETDARIDSENSKTINKLLDNAKTDISLLNIPEGVDVRDYIANIINNTKLTDNTKDAHFKELDALFPKKGQKKETTTYGSDVALNEWFDHIVTGKAKGNTFIQSVNRDERLTAKGKELLVGWAEEYNTKRTAYEKELVNNFLSGFATEGTDLPANIVAFLNSSKSQLTLELNRILSEGEAAGVSVHSMLGDTTSEYYIGYKLMDIYQSSILQNLNRQNEPKAGTRISDVITGKVTAEEYYTDKRNQAYSIFFDTDPTTEGNQLSFLKQDYEIAEEGSPIVVGVKESDADPNKAIFLHRLLNKPLPPAYEETGPRGEKESIESYVNSKKWKKYQKDYAAWIEEGKFNSEKIPTIKKFFGTTDLPKIKVKN